ncbi:HAD-IA family hydrolase [Polycladidibacter stylochi]|uniref:HAD-IA family hydrolase n=1 Tax=Polycladidibacter stylochi TaxID=1807766 RepID=UPI0008351626|nr:HAD-IA family hydrolase [Pseudovibrio stylochi]
MYLVIFDCDGTLIDSQDAIMQGLYAAYEAVELPRPTRAEGLSIVGLSLEEAFLQLVGDARADLVPVMKAAYRKRAIERRESGEDRSPLYPGTRQVLDALAQRDDVLLGVATGKHSRGVAYMVEEHGLQNKFVTIQTSDRAPSKPNPAMIMQAMAETGVDAARTVMIGDTSYDMLMARNAGVHGLGVSWGYHQPAQLMEAGAFQVIDKFEQLIPAISKQLSWSEVQYA